MQHTRTLLVLSILLAAPTLAESGWCIVCDPPPQCEPNYYSPYYSKCGSYENIASGTMYYKRNYGCVTPPGEPGKTSWYIYLEDTIPTWTCGPGSWCYL